MKESRGSSRLLLDLGSRSAKAYLLEQSLTEVHQVTWELIENEPTEPKIRHSLNALIAPYHSRVSDGISAFGTEAMRRNRALESAVSSVCQELGIKYRTLTHREEATLILEAVRDPGRHTIVNAGGGSVQIVCPETKRLTLLGFGIADLNRAFSLLDAPSRRQIDHCIRFVSDQLWVTCDGGTQSAALGELGHEAR